LCFFFFFLSDLFWLLSPFFCDSLFYTSYVLFGSHEMKGLFGFA
jgi:hypothetical protein